MTSQQLITTILMISVFVLVFSGWTICVLLWMVQYARRRKRLQKRMGFVDEETRKVDTLQLWREEYQARRATTKQRRETLGERLERLHADAGWKAPAAVVILSVLGVAVMVCVAIVMLGYGWMLGVAAAAVVVIVFQAVTVRQIDRRIDLFERQFVESLGIAARALRAGHPLVGAFQSISEEIPDPIGPIFGEICQVNLSEWRKAAADRT